MSRVHIVIDDPALSRALASRVGAVLGDGVVADGEPREGGDVVIASESGMGPEDIWPLLQAGVQVVILAAVPRAASRRAFLAAGAFDYVPMDVELGGLLESLARARSGGDRGGDEAFAAAG